VEVFGQDPADHQGQLPLAAAVRKPPGNAHPEAVVNSGAYGKFRYPIATRN
jgi:hypothetical protein